jgi:hypothetical protein
MSTNWNKIEDAILDRFIAGEIDLGSAADLMPRRTKNSIEVRASLRRCGIERTFFAPKPNQPVPAKPRGMTAEQIAWAEANPLAKEAEMILGFAATGPVLL